MDEETPLATKPLRDAHGHLMCPYCGQRAVLFKCSAAFYAGTDYGPVWACLDCKAWVGCHPGTCKPLGRLADKGLRRAKMAAHTAFDALWRAKVRKEKCRAGYARAAGYRWLREQLGITSDVCHIGMMNAAMCRKVVDLCRPYLRSARR